jgi:hypothetical protein
MKKLMMAVVLTAGFLGFANVQAASVKVSVPAVTVKLTNNTNFNATIWGGAYGVAVYNSTAITNGAAKDLKSDVSSYQLQVEGASRYVAKADEYVTNYANFTIAGTSLKDGKNLFLTADANNVYVKNSDGAVLQTIRWDAY